MKIVIALILLFSQMALAAPQVERPVDPFGDLPTGEKLTFLERDRGIRYLTNVVAYDVSRNMPLSYSVAHILDTVRAYEPKFGDMVESTPLALLNSSLYVLAIKFRHASPLEHNGKLLDSPSHVESREFTKAIARVLFAAVATLPDQPQKVEMEFSRQKTLSTPHRLLTSYLTPEKRADGTQPEILFGGELENDIKAKIEMIEKREAFTSRFVQKIRSSFGPKSCRAAFL